MASNFEFLKYPLKLISSLLETPPLIVVGSAKASHSAPLVLNQVTAPEGLCGLIPSEVGSTDWVCQAFGTVMPGIVFLVSVFVLITTFTFLAWYCVRHRATKRELKKLLHNLNLVSPSSQSVLVVIRSSGQKLPPLSMLADKIEDSYIDTDIGSDGSSLLKKSVSEIAFKNETLESWTGKSLADEIPNWLSALGLLTTFVAILLGLQHVKVLTNMEVQGIGSLVNGLSGKFFSSIVALSCGLTVTILNYFLSEKIDHLWKNAIYKLEILLPHLNTEQMLLDLIKEQKYKKTKV